MNNNLAQKAISKALAGEWKEAISLNKNILEENPDDTDALNRLARAYAETGELTKARKLSKKVLKKDPFNSIAEKSLKKWKGLKKGDTKKSKPSSPRSFLEEPGKTKMVSLLHLGDPKLIASLDSGDEVEMKTKSHRISIVTSDGKYIGRLADDLSARLKKLMKYGNEYKVFIKSINEEEVKVFIRETKRAKKLEDIPSFSSEKIDYISFTPPELVYKKEENKNEEEED